MAIAHDAVSESTEAANPSWTHTPVGTPRAVVVFIVQNGGTADETTGVTYGGVAMTLVRSEFSTAGDEDGGCSCWFLGSSIPTGAQTVTQTGGASGKWGVAATMTAAADCAVEGSNGLTSASLDDPSFTVTTGVGVETMGYVGLFSALGTPANVTAGAGFTKFHDHDFGTRTGHAERLSANDAGGDWTAAWVTSAADDVASIGAAIREVAGDTGDLFEKSGAGESWAGAGGEVDSDQFTEGGGETHAGAGGEASVEQHTEGGAESFAGAGGDVSTDQFVEGAGSSDAGAAGDSVAEWYQEASGGADGGAGSEHSMEWTRPGGGESHAGGSGSVEFLAAPTVYDVSGGGESHAGGSGTVEFLPAAEGAPHGTPRFVAVQRVREDVEEEEALALILAAA